MAKIKSRGHMVRDRMRSNSGNVTKTFVVLILWGCSLQASYADGALARNPSDNSGTVVVNKSTKDDAIHDAHLACGADCEIVTTFKNTCVAYAADHRANSTIFGYGQASDKYKAGEAALDQCQSRGGSCTIMDSGCDGN